jgi:hypothetical protein
MCGLWDRNPRLVSAQLADGSLAARFLDVHGRSIIHVSRQEALTVLFASTRPPFAIRQASGQLRPQGPLCADRRGAGAFSMYPAPSAGGVRCAPGDERVASPGGRDTRFPGDAQRAPRGTAAFGRGPLRDGLDERAELSRRFSRGREAFAFGHDGSRLPCRASRRARPLRVLPLDAYRATVAWWPLCSTTGNLPRVTKRPLTRLQLPRNRLAPSPSACSLVRLKRTSTSGSRRMKPRVRSSRKRRGAVARG